MNTILTFSPTTIEQVKIINNEKSQLILLHENLFFYS